MILMSDRLRLGVMGSWIPSRALAWTKLPCGSLSGPGLGLRPGNIPDLAWPRGGAAFSDSKYESTRTGFVATGTAATQCGTSSESAQAATEWQAAPGSDSSGFAQ